MTAVLEIRGMTAGYDGSSVLRGVDLDLERGRVLALLGRNGVGKSTVVMSVMGLVPVTGGTVHLAGELLTGRRPDVVARAGVGLIPQGRRVFAPLTVEENLKIAIRRPAAGAAGEPWTLERVYTLLPRLAERRRNRGDQLSGGEQQMLAIGRALLANPTVLLVDEPSDGLAPSIVTQVTEVLAALRADAVSILLVEQDLHAALRVADDVAVMEKGRIVHRATAEEFRADPDRAGELLGV